MEGEKLRGVTFRQRRLSRGLSVRRVAGMLRLPERNIIAYELGVELQLPREALEKIGGLNTKWTAEDIEMRRMRRYG